MKTIPSGLAAHYALSSTSLATFLKVEARSGAVFGVTTLDTSVVVDGDTYIPGLNVSDLVSTADLAVDNLDSTVLKILDALTDADLTAGLLDFANFTIFECNWRAPGDGINVLKRGTTGRATIAQGQWTLEFRSLKQGLQQPLGAITSKTCRAHLGDSACKVDLAPFTFSLSVTADPTDSQHFVASGATQVDDYFGEGIVTFTDGPNAGYSAKVKDFVSLTHTFTLALPMPFAIGNGDHFTAIAGCRKRHDRTLANPSGVSDCLDKFDNVLNFQGEPHLPGPDGLTALPTATGDQ